MTTWLTRHIRGIMLVSGALTCTMFFAAVAPDAALQSNFGTTITGPAAHIVVRNWGVLVGLVGLMLIYGAFTPPVRGLVLVVAGASKLTFVVLVLTYGRELLAYQVRTAVVVDAIWVLVFAGYLHGARRESARVPA